MTNVAKIYKITDTAVQSAIFVFIAYRFDFASNLQLIIPVLILWQIFSLFIHFFIRSRSKLKKERFFYFVFLAATCMFYAFAHNQLFKNSSAISSRNNFLHAPLHDIVFFSVVMILTVWYYIICIREFKSAKEKGKQD